MVNRLQRAAAEERRLLQRHQPRSPGHQEVGDVVERRVLKRDRWAAVGQAPCHHVHGYRRRVGAHHPPARDRSAQLPERVQERAVCFIFELIDSGRLGL